MHPRLEGILAYLAGVRGELTSVVEGTPAERMIQPAPGQWNGAQIVQHLGKVEGSCTKMLEGLFAKALAEGLPEDLETGSLVGALDAYRVPDRSRKIVAPERIAPDPVPDLAACWSSLRGVRQRTLAAVATVDGRDLTRLSAPHPIFGPLNGYQWVLIIGQHEKRHLSQMEEVLRLA